MMIIALVPPSDSIVNAEHKNVTSWAINVITQNFNFLWNDIFPYAPQANANVSQQMLPKLVLDRDQVSDLIMADWSRVFELQKKMLQVIHSQ